MEIKLDLTHLLNEENDSNDIVFKIENSELYDNYFFNVDDFEFSLVIIKDKL